MPRGEMVKKTRARHRPIDDVAVATAWWDRRSRNADDDDDLPEGDALDGEYVEINEPYRAPAKVGRNEPCPCGSGKKYKKCCGR